MAISVRKTVIKNWLLASLGAMSATLACSGGGSQNPPANASALRPTLMTSLAFILGVVPLVLATGAGENGRHSVGTTVFGGMIMSTILNLFFIPVLYLIIEGWREHGKTAPA